MHIFDLSFNLQRIRSVLILWLFFKFAFTIIQFPIHVIKTELEREIMLLKHEVIPDYISSVPNQTLKVTWISNETGEKIISNFGNVIRPQDLINIPTVEWKAEPNTNYTIIISEIDAPCRSSRYKVEKQVWLVVNIPQTNISAGKTLTSYARPTPWADSGEIRVQVSVYKQHKPGIDWSWVPRLYEKASDRSRECFSSKNFTQKYGMSDVIALNFFLTEWNPKVTYPEDEYESYEDEAQWL
ncbi:protein D3 isoform X1 [Bemisia tabaci]|uniref:protein D3 isoform X1 n=1 Tax=Bemisia tabaci TaxID=7038 RepID=UPI003B280E2C